MQKLILQRFQAAFGKPATLWGKVPDMSNLLGDHTENDGGLALPYAVESPIAMAATAAHKGCTLLAMDTGEKIAFPVAELPVPPPGHWSHSLLKVMEEFRRRGHPVRAMEAVFSGTLSGRGCGCSGAGAMACAMVLILENLSEASLGRHELAVLCHAAGKEAGWPMDAFPILLGTHDCALLLDGRTLGVTHIPLQIHPYRLVRVHAKLPPGRLKAVLQERRRECQGALEKLRKQRPGLPDLRALDKAVLESAGNELTPGEHARVLYQIGENQRVVDAEKALLAGDPTTLGRIMNESHTSLDRQFQVVDPEMSTLVEMALSQVGVLGARLAGGDGRCTLNLVHRDGVAAFAASLKQGLLHKYAADMEFTEEHPTDGATLMALTPSLATPQ